KKLCVYSKMQDSLDAVGKQAQQQETAQQQQQQEAEAEEEGGRAGGLVKEPQPAETEYLSSRCVLFTYFQGDIGDVVDEHFSRALSQPSGFSASPAKTPRPVGSALWKGELRRLQGFGTGTPRNKRLWESLSQALDLFFNLVPKNCLCEHSLHTVVVDWVSQVSSVPGVCRSV
ncbi:VGLL3 protein, partial [Amia calva]|nr:VGLL3 protein [Amia calva]